MTNEELKEKFRPILLDQAHTYGQCDGRIDTWALAQFGQCPIPEPVIATILRESGEFIEIEYDSRMRPVPRSFFKLK